MPSPRVGVSADAFVAVVRAYADRVHDDVRRLGCTATEAAEVVETSALGLAERLRVRPHEVRDLVGTWFRDARVYAERVASGDADEELAGEGIVQASSEDAAARSALAQLADRDRVALLLRDAYDLPYVSAGVALGVDVDATAVLVARARLRFLGLAGSSTPGQPEEHDAELATLARLADGQLPLEAVGPAERHVAKCTACAPLLPALREARRLLSGLAILAMADADRDALIARATAVAERVLPSADEVAAASDDGPLRVLPPLPLAAACLGGAFVLGAVIALAGGGTSLRRSAPPFDPDSPTPTVSATSATPTPTATPSRSSTPTPTRTATPSRSPTPTAQQTYDWFVGSERIIPDRSSGPNGATVRLTGSGWKTGEIVTIVYLNALGVETGQRATAVPDGEGNFTASLVCFDQTNVPGPHRIRARNASGQEEFATYNAQA